MANTAVTPVKTTDVNEMSPNLTFNTVSATSDSFVVDVAQSTNRKVFFIADNSAGSAEATVTVKAGDNVAGVNDLELKVKNGEIGFFQIDTNAYMNANGENRGKVVIDVSATTCKLAVAEAR